MHPTKVKAPSVLCLVLLVLTLTLTQCVSSQPSNSAPPVTAPKAMPTTPPAWTATLGAAIATQVPPGPTAVTAPPPTPAPRASQTPTLARRGGGADDGAR